MSTIAVKLAAESEVAACAALLPEVTAPKSEFFIARCDGAFAGAAAVVWESWMQPAGFPLWIHVLPPYRRKGVGRALVEAAAEVIEGETSGLWTHEALRDDNSAKDFLQACGFQNLRRQHHFIADIDPLMANIEPNLARLRQRGRVPADARVVPLAEAPIDKVGWLLSAELGSGPLRLIERLRHAAAAASRRERSIVTMQGSKVTGVLICSVKDGVGVVDGWVTAPGWRSGWTNLLLLEAILGQGKADGYDAFRFYCEETVTDTMKLARRSGASETATLSRFYRPAARAA